MRCMLREASALPRPSSRACSPATAPWLGTFHVRSVLDGVPPQLRASTSGRGIDVLCNNAGVMALADQASSTGCPAPEFQQAAMKLPGDQGRLRCADADEPPVALSPHQGALSPVREPLPASSVGTSKTSERSVLPKRAGLPQIRKAASIKGEARIVNHSSGALDRMVLLRLPAHAKSRGACPCHEVREKIPIATWSLSTWARALTTAALGHSTPSQNSTVHATEFGCRDCSRNGGNLGGNGNSMFFGDARWKRPDFSERILCCRMPLRVAQVSAD